jgi:hypothetical protein
MKRALVVLLAAWLLPAAVQAQDPDSGVVVVRNELDRDLLVWINGEPRGLAESESEARFEGVPAGILSLLVSAPGAEGIVASERRTMTPGRTFLWTIYPIPVEGEEKGSTVLVVHNDLDRSVRVELAGNVAGWIEAGAVRTFPRVASGDVTARVEDEMGSVIHAFALTLIPRETMVWRIGPLPSQAETMAPPEPLERLPDR